MVKVTELFIRCNQRCKVSGIVTFDRKIKRSDLNVVISRPRLFHVFLCS